jgi:hypothetical protein
MDFNRRVRIAQVEAREATERRVAEQRARNAAATRQRLSASAADASRVKRHQLGGYVDAIDTYGDRRRGELVDKEGEEGEGDAEADAANSSDGGGGGHSQKKKKKNSPASAKAGGSGGVSTPWDAMTKLREETRLLRATEQAFADRQPEPLRRAMARVMHNSAEPFIAITYFKADTLLRVLEQEEGERHLHLAASFSRFQADARRAHFDATLRPAVDDLLGALDAEPHLRSVQEFGVAEAVQAAADRAAVVGARLTDPLPRRVVAEDQLAAEVAAVEDDVETLQAAVADAQAKVRQQRDAVANRLEKRGRAVRQTAREVVDPAFARADQALGVVEDGPAIYHHSLQLIAAEEAVRAAHSDLRRAWDALQAVDVQQPQAEQEEFEPRRAEVADKAAALGEASGVLETQTDALRRQLVQMYWELAQLPDTTPLVEFEAKLFEVACAEGQREAVAAAVAEEEEAEASPLSVVEEEEVVVREEANQPEKEGGGGGSGEQLEGSGDFDSLAGEDDAVEEGGGAGAGVNDAGGGEAPSDGGDGEGGEVSSAGGDVADHLEDGSGAGVCADDGGSRVGDAREEKEEAEEVPGGDSAPHPDDGADAEQSGTGVKAAAAEEEEEEEDSAGPQSAAAASDGPRATAAAADDNGTGAGSSSSSSSSSSRTSSRSTSPAPSLPPLTPGLAAAAARMERVRTHQRLAGATSAAVLSRDPTALSSLLERLDARPDRRVLFGPNDARVLRARALDVVSQLHAEKLLFATVLRHRASRDHLQRALEEARDTSRLGQPSGGGVGGGGGGGAGAGAGAEAGGGGLPSRVYDQAVRLLHECDKKHFSRELESARKEAKHGRDAAPLRAALAAFAARFRELLLHVYPAPEVAAMASGVIDGEDEPEVGGGGDGDGVLESRSSQDDDDAATAAASAAGAAAAASDRSGEGGVASESKQQEQQQESGQEEQQQQQQQPLAPVDPSDEAFVPQSKEMVDTARQLLRELRAEVRLRAVVEDVSRSRNAAGLLQGLAMAAEHGLVAGLSGEYDGNGNATLAAAFALKNCLDRVGDLERVLEATLQRQKTIAVARSAAAAAAAPAAPEAAEAAEAAAATAAAAAAATTTTTTTTPAVAAEGEAAAFAPLAAAGTTAPAAAPAAPAFDDATMKEALLQDDGGAAVDMTALSAALSVAVGVGATAKLDSAVREASELIADCQRSVLQRLREVLGDTVGEEVRAATPSRQQEQQEQQQHHHQQQQQQAPRRPQPKRQQAQQLQPVLLTPAAAARPESPIEQLRREQEHVAQSTERAAAAGFRLSVEALDAVLAAVPRAAFPEGASTGGHPVLTSLVTRARELSESIHRRDAVRSQLQAIMARVVVGRGAAGATGAAAGGAAAGSAAAGGEARQQHQQQHPHAITFANADELERAIKKVTDARVAGHYDGEDDDDGDADAAADASDAGTPQQQQRHADDTAAAALVSEARRCLGILREEGALHLVVEEAQRHPSTGARLVEALEAARKAELPARAGGGVYEQGVLLVQDLAERARQIVQDQLDNRGVGNGNDLQEQVGEHSYTKQSREQWRRKTGR